MSGTRTRFSEPDRVEDKNTREYLTNLVRDLAEFDTRIFSEDLGLIFDAARIHPTSKLTSSRTLGKFDSIVLVDASSNNVTITLPVAVEMPRKLLTIKRTDNNGAFNVSVEGSGVEFPVVLSGVTRQSVDVFSDGTSFWVL